ncbi:MAG: hypothetical protein MZV64_30175 [Ignavibacteriales bacterium]|nr:hypothetical protein [Ignavibacteriales bacterium]
MEEDRRRIGREGVQCRAPLAPRRGEVGRGERRVHRGVEGGIGMAPVVEGTDAATRPLLHEPSRARLVQIGADVAVEVPLRESFLEDRKVHRRHRHLDAERTPGGLQRLGVLPAHRAGRWHEGCRATAAGRPSRATRRRGANRPAPAAPRPPPYRTRACSLPRPRSTAAATSAPPAPRRPPRPGRARAGPIGCERESLSNGTIAEHGVRRSPAVRHAEAEEAEHRRRVAHQTGGSCRRRPVPRRRHRRPSPAGRPRATAPG